jgi:ribosome-associated heat shock protein Hsp15
VLKVTGFAERRGSATDAQALCQDLEPPMRTAEADATPPLRDTGSGRPTKRERRAIDRFTGNRGQ